MGNEVFTQLTMNPTTSQGRKWEKWLGSRRTLCGLGHRMNNTLLSGGETGSERGPDSSKVALIVRERAGDRTNDCPMLSHWAF